MIPSCIKFLPSYCQISAEKAEWEKTRNALSEKMTVVDPFFKNLSDEKLLGWESPAVSALWKSRTRKFKVESSGNRAADSKKFTPEDMKYFKFYKDVLPVYGGDVFVKRDHHDEKFLDIGSAPGGLSKYLTTEFGWRGYAFSLSPSEGGLEMKFSNPPRLRFSLANVTKENEWRRIIDLCNNAGFEEVDFVNIGVVVDFGQVDADGGGADEMCCRSISSSISQFLILLHRLKEGGNAMWIHSIAHLDTFFFFLQFIVDSFDSVRIFNTLAPARSPVYIIMKGFKRSSTIVKRFTEVLIRDNGTVTNQTISKWQVSDFMVIQNIMLSHPDITNDIHNIWIQKRDCLRETRLFAEKRFSECGHDDSKFAKSDAASSCFTVMSGAERRLAPSLASEAKEFRERRNETTTAAGLCSIGSTESIALMSGSLSAPKTFGRPPRQNKS